jgi:hypothetical protein
MNYKISGRDVTRLEVYSLDYTIIPEVFFTPYSVHTLLSPLFNIRIAVNIRSNRPFAIVLFHIFAYLSSLFVVLQHLQTGTQASLEMREVLGMPNNSFVSTDLTLLTSTWQRNSKHCVGLLSHS